jgi:bifunctional DNA-binding transcriptional regulator/antitoxin component of YhaV-PrlF toxin-antitoxin module
MAKVTSKLQVTVPKVVAEQYRIRPGDEIQWVPAGDSIRVTPAGKSEGTLSARERVRRFDLATARQKKRNTRSRVKPGQGRGWTREGLYERGRTR